MKISHTPAGASKRIGLTRPSHPLKSPTTLTRSACGPRSAKGLRSSNLGTVASSRLAIDQIPQCISLLFHRRGFDVVELGVFGLHELVALRDERALFVLRCGAVVRIQHIGNLHS